MTFYYCFYIRVESRSFFLGSVLVFGAGRVGGVLRLFVRVGYGFFNSLEGFFFCCLIFGVVRFWGFDFSVVVLIV